MDLWPLPLTNVTGVVHIADAWPQRHLPVVVAVTSVSKEVCLVCSAPSFHTAIAEHSKSLKESIFCPLLPPQIDGSTLRTLCLQHGPLITFHLNLTQGNAVVRYSSKEEAAKAQKSLHMYVFSSVPSLLSSHQCPVLWRHPHTAAQVVPWAELRPFLALILEIQDQKNMDRLDSSGLAFQLVDSHLLLCLHRVTGFVLCPLGKVQKEPLVTQAPGLQQPTDHLLSMQNTKRPALEYHQRWGTLMPAEPPLCSPLKHVLHISVLRGCQIHYLA